MTKKPTANAYDDDDFDAIVGELDAQEAKLDAAKEAKKAEDKKIKARAKELGIPLRALNPAIRTSKAFRNLQKIADGVQDDHKETHLDMVKRMLGALADTPLGKAAVDAVRDGVDRSFAGEQAEGEKLLSRVGKKKPVSDPVGFTDAR